jgi:hypothetical protein
MERFSICSAIRMQSERAYVNTFERRAFIRAQALDVKVANTSFHQSRRQRAQATKLLRKALAIKAASKAETISYPRQAG